MDIFLNELVQFYLNNTTKSLHFNSKHNIVLYPQNGNRIVTIEFVTLCINSHDPSTFSVTLVKQFHLYLSVNWFVHNEHTGIS